MSSFLRDSLKDSLTESPAFSLSVKSLLTCLCALLALSIATLPVFAISRQVTLTEMTTGAGRVVYGRIAEVRNGTHPDYSHIAVTFVTLDVIEMLKGSAAKRLTFMQFASAQGQSQAVAHNYHMPKYAVGEEVVLFLYPESRYGFTSPVGEGQGKFQVSNDPRTGRRALVNDRGNRQLFEPLRNEKAQSHFRLNSAERSLIAQQNGVADLETFRSMIRKLAAGGSTVNVN
ncbi:MAG TPA: hypothetical protein VFD58_18890 [Blastocatellia bacterium]|nr:hypothetical protein [Blastocatellia bacterium]